MPLAYRLADYAAYVERVGAATYIDASRRTDPARIPSVWENLGKVADTYGPPWVVMIWTKDLRGALTAGHAVLGDLIDRGTTVTVQLTVTGLAGTIWEPRVPTDVLDHISDASLIGGPKHVCWRYDPIIPTVHEAERFRELAARVAEAGIRRGVINFIAKPGRYRRVDRRLGDVLPGWREGMPGYTAAWRLDTAAQLVAIARQYGVALACCAESRELADAVPGLGPAACGDYEWFAVLSGQRPERPKRTHASRSGCGCLPYFDVGSYGHWSRCHGCLYCYAG